MRIKLADKVFHRLSRGPDIGNAQFIKHIRNPDRIRRNTDDIFAGGKEIKTAPYDCAGTGFQSIFHFFTVFGKNDPAIITIGNDCTFDRFRNLHITPALSVTAGAGH
jgi:hypothetical protein